MYLLTSDTNSCDEDDEEVGVSVVEELVDKPGTTNGTLSDKLQSILYTLSGEMWYLTAGPEKLPERKKCKSFKKQNRH